MSNKTQELEHEIAAMEDRLASVKVKVEIEREAWKKSYRTGKKGTKWKGAARGQPSKTPTGNPSHSPESNGERERRVEVDITIMPSYWDALELAQYLQTKRLTAFAQVVICEQIAGKALLETPLGKMRQLFQGIIASNSDPSWKAFLRECATLLKLQKQFEKPSDAESARSDPSSKDSGQALSSPTSPPGTSSLFPQISPRMPSLMMASSTSSTAPFGDDRVSETRRMKPAMPMRKPPANTQQLATCWNCGTRFPRSQGSTRGGLQNPSKALSTRTFCSNECQHAIENADISISSSISATLQVSSTARDSNELAPHPHGALPNKSRSLSIQKSNQHHKSKSKCDGMLRNPKESTEGFNFLHVTHKGSLVEEAPRPPPSLSSSSGKQNGAMIRKRIVMAGGCSPSAPSISSTRSSLPGTIPPLMLTNASDPSRQSKVYQQSVYKLDPDLYQANGATFASCFYDGATATGASTTRKSLMRLQEYISVKTLHHLSLTSRSWFDAVHQSSLADPLWGFHLLRIWKRSEEDELFLREIGVLKKPERPRKMMMKLTRQVGRVVLENMKVLLNPENWHLATPMSVHPTLTLQSVLRISKPGTANRERSGEQPLSPKADTRPDMFEQIAIIFNRKGEIVAVRAQELIRPIAADQLLTDILHGMRSGALATVECRRLRLFSAANRLPFDQWHLLSANCKVVFDFYWSSSNHTNPSESPIARVWHQKILERMQKSMQQRLLGKESVQQVLKAVSERNGPPPVLVSLEKFLTLCHASMGKPAAAQTVKKRKEQVLSHPPHPAMFQPK